MKSRSELAINGNKNVPRMRHALSESHLSNETFPQSPYEQLMPCAFIDTTEQLEDETCPSLDDSYDERLLALLDCYKAPQYLDPTTGGVYAPYNQDLPVECEKCLSEILNRTYREICHRFRNLRKNFQSTAIPQPNSQYNTRQRYQNIDASQNDPSYLFGPSQSFPAHVARRPQRGVIDAGVVRRLDFSPIPSQCTEQTNLMDVLPPQYNSMPCKDLADVSMPPYQTGASSSGYYSSKSNARDVSPIPVCADELENISAPTGVHTASVICTPEEDLNEVSMPCYGQYSQQSAYASEILQNVSPPVFSSTPGSPVCMCKQKAQKRSMNLTNQCLEDVSAPSFVKSVTPQQYMTSECLENVSMPTQSSMRTISTPQTSQRQLRPTSTQKKSMTNEQLADVSMPYAPNIQMTPREYFIRNMSFPDEQIANVSAPCFESTPKSRVYFQRNAQQKSRRLQRTVPSECFEDVTSPDLVKSSAYSQQFPNEFICNESMPSFASSQNCSRRQNPSENLDNITAPEYASSYCNRQRTMPSEWLDQQSIPASFRSERCTYPSGTSENLQDISAPSFETCSPRPVQEPLRRDDSINRSRIYNILDRIFSGSRSGKKQPSSNNSSKMNIPQRSAQRQVYPDERLDDVSAPSLNITRTPQYSNMNRTQRSEYLNDVSMPTINRSFEQTPVRHWQPPQSLPRSRLEDVSPPSYNRSDTRSTSQRDLSQKRIQNISKQDMERIRRRLLSPTERLEDQSMPSLPGSPRIASTPVCRVDTQNSNITSQYLADISAPTFNTTASSQNNTTKSLGIEQLSTLVNCLNNMLVSQFGLTLTPQKATTSQQPPCTLTVTHREELQCLPSERLQNVSMPSFGDVSGITFDMNNRDHRGSTMKYTCYESDKKLDDGSLPVYICSPQEKRYQYKLNGQIHDAEYLENQSPPKFITVSRTESGTGSEGKQEPNYKTLLNGTKDIFQKIGEERETLAQDKQKTETKPVVPIPGSLGPVINLKAFLETNKTPESKKVDDTMSETTNLENVSSPEFSSTLQSPESIEPEIPSPGTTKGFRNMKALADLAKNKYKEMDKKKSERHEDPGPPLLSSTPISSSQNLQQQKSQPKNETAKTIDKQAKEQKKNDNSSIWSRKSPKTPEQSNLDDVSAPSFVQTPESIQRMRSNKSLAQNQQNVAAAQAPTRSRTNNYNQQNVERSRTPPVAASRGETRSRTNDYDGPSTSGAIRRPNGNDGSGVPQSTSRGRNYERTPRSRRNDDAQSTISSIPQMRAYDTPAANRNYSASEFVLEMRDYETPTGSRIDAYNEPSTSRGVPRSKQQSSTSVGGRYNEPSTWRGAPRSKQQSSTSVGPRGPTNKDTELTAREQTRRARTQTSNTRFWNAVESNSNRRSNSACQSVPVYDHCDQCYQQMYCSQAPSYINYNPCQNYNNDCVEIIHDCCYPCQRCQRRRSC